MNDGAKERKLIQGGLYGAVTIVVVWIVSLFGVTIPTEVAQAMTIIFSSAAAWYTA